MKKQFALILIVVLSSLHISCSSDDNKEKGNFIKARFNNKDVRFNITATEQLGPFTTDGYTYFDVKVSAVDKNDADKVLIMSSEKGVVGTNLIWRFDFYDNNVFYTKENNSFTTIITENSNSKYIGSFSGTLINNDTSDIITVTNGIFEIKF